LSADQAIALGNSTRPDLKGTRGTYPPTLSREDILGASQLRINARLTSRGTGRGFAKTMATPLQRPWAILLCKFKDDTIDPSTTRLRDMHAQWVTAYGASWVADNLHADAATDERTILNLYTRFFTEVGGDTFNVVRYWDQMSHGNIDVSGSQVFPCTLDIDKAKGAALAASPGGGEYQNDIFKKAKKALFNQYGVDWKSFYGVVVSFQSPDYGSQGGTYDGGPGVYMDIRFLRNSGIAAWGHEMGHAFGLDHSRRSGSDDDYKDKWDIMSALDTF
jgi:hypothetical protein